MNLVTYVFLAIIICRASFSAVLGASKKPQTEDDLDPDTKNEFKKFKKDNSKNYGVEENNLRAIQFSNNLLKIKQRNKKNRDYKEGVTPFTDLDEIQFIATYLIKIGNIPSPTQLPTVTAVSAATSIDWTINEWAIRNQGNCGSCWAFSAVGAIQRNEKIKKGIAIKDYSEQQVVDCCRSAYGSYRSQGCNGGYPHEAFSYLVGGSSLQALYPYRTSTNACRNVAKSRIISGYTQYSGSSNALIALASGTASVLVDASTWQNYVTGVLSCSRVSFNHAVILVGVQSGSYWKVRNSWGTRWGELGYIKLNYASPCGLTQYIYVPKIL